MKKLKKLDECDLDEIADFLYDEIFKYINSKVPSKEIKDIDINFEISFEDKNDINILDIKTDISADFDELSNYDLNLVSEAFDNAFELLDGYLDEHFRG
ncbi:MAG: DUF3194 domain-containing protein [Methanobrevibacter sp.]|jgi:hypothetical protein|nr:DUF3194 domain-containing protein [Candidatus Methanovirga basalitermitum]